MKWTHAIPILSHAQINEVTWDKIPFALKWFRAQWILRSTSNTLRYQHTAPGIVTYTCHVYYTVIAVGV